MLPALDDRPDGDHKTSKKTPYLADLSIGDFSLMWIASELTTHEPIASRAFSRPKRREALVHVEVPPDDEVT